MISNRNIGLTELVIENDPALQDWLAKKIFKELTDFSKDEVDWVVGLFSLGQKVAHKLNVLVNEYKLRDGKKENNFSSVLSTSLNPNILKLSPQEESFDFSDYVCCDSVSYPSEKIIFINIVFDNPGSHLENCPWKNSNIAMRQYEAMRLVKCGIDWELEEWLQHINATLLQDVLVDSYDYYKTN